MFNLHQEFHSPTLFLLLLILKLGLLLLLLILLQSAKRVYRLISLWTVRTIRPHTSLCLGLAGPNLTPTPTPTSTPTTNSTFDSTRTSSSTITSTVKLYS